METKAICCVIGALLINLTLGSFYSMSNILPYLTSYMRSNGSPSITTAHGSWLTSAFLLGQGFFIIVGSVLEQKFSSRLACIFGCIIHSLATFLTTYAVDWGFTSVIIIYGLASGMGCGSAYMASIIAAQKWYPQSKGVVTGLIVAGFGFGGLIFTFLQTLYMNPSNLSPNATGGFDESVNGRVPHLFLYMSTIFAISQTVGCCLIYPPPSPAGSESTAPVSATRVTEDALPQMSTYTDAFSYKILYVIGLMMMLVAPGVTFVNTLGKKFGQLYISDDRFLATAVAVCSIANASGRLFWGYLIDKLAFRMCFSIKVILFATLIVTFPFGFVLSSKATYLVWMLGLFFGFSGTFVLFPVFIEQVFGVRYNGLIYGTLYIMLALSSMLTSILIQTTLSPTFARAQTPESTTWARIGPCVVISVLYVTSLLMYSLLVPVRRVENAIKRRVDVDSSQSKNTLLHREDLFPLDRGSLAEKTNLLGPKRPTEKLEKENSLGSIVKFRDVPADDGKVKAFGASWPRP